MLSCNAYLMVHFTGLILLFTAFGGLVVSSWLEQNSSKARKMSAMLHGIGLLLLIVGGFGLMKNLGISHSPGAWPGWIYAKVFVWLLLGGITAVLKKNGGLAKPMLFLLPVVGIAAAFLGVYKPF